MPKTPPLTPAASRLKELQARRLKAIRELLEPFQKDAAEAAGVSEHSWGRYESGQSEINPLALAFFVKKYPDATADWVLTGDMRGLSNEVIDRLYQGYPHVVAASRDDSVALSLLPARPSRSRRASRTSYKEVVE
jgi:DNA-binding XRE family transcriptional regulator